MYSCPNCKSEIKKGVNKCPTCGHDIYWKPFLNDEDKSDINISNIVSKITMNGSFTKSDLSVIYEKMYTQMFDTIKKFWKVNTVRTPKGIEFIATLSVTEPKDIAKPAPVKKQAPVIKGPNDYDRYVEAHKKEIPNTAPEVKPELAQFAQRLKDTQIFRPEGFN